MSAGVAWLNLGYVPLHYEHTFYIVLCWDLNWKPEQTSEGYVWKHADLMTLQNIYVIVNFFPHELDFLKTQL